MENAATMKTLLQEMALVFQGLIDAGYDNQFERIIYTVGSDFHIDFPDDKEYFALFVEEGILKYYAFNTKEEANRYICAFYKEIRRCYSVLYCS